MKPVDLPTTWRLARRTERMNPSVIREILKLTEQPGIISMAGGLPSPDTFPVEAMRVATERVLRETPREALQYAPSEGYGAAARLGRRAHGRAGPARRCLAGADHHRLAAGARPRRQGPDRRRQPVAVEAPTYLGALQAFSPFEPEVVSVAATMRGRCPAALRPPPARASSTCCRTSRTRAAAAWAKRAAPSSPQRPRPSACRSSRTTRTATCGSTRRRRRRSPSRWAEGTVYLGSFSKVLAPGLRLGYVIAPPRCSRSCCRPSRPPTCTRPASTSASCTR